MSGTNRTYRLSEIESNQGITFSHAGATPGHHCPMHTALAAMRNIRGISSLVLGMPECSFYSRYVMEKPVEVTGELHYTYVLDSNEVVFGCREGLIKALEEMEQDGAKAIMVIMTCIPALIGEDVKEIAETFSREHNAKAVCIDMAHYKRNGYEYGYYEGYDALSEFCKEKELKSNQVSILGSLKGREGDCLKNWLKSNAIDLLEIGARFVLEDFIEITSSVLIIVTDIHYLPLANRLKKEYNIPVVFLGGAYSVSEITACYKTIKEQLQLKDEAEFAEISELIELEGNIQSLFAGSCFIIPTVIEDVLLLTNYLTSLSMKPCILHIEEYQLWMKEWKKSILHQKVDPYITFVVQQEINYDTLEKSGFLEEKGFRFSIGEISLKDVASMKIERFFLTSFLGYERTFALLHSLEYLWKEEEHAII